MSELLRSEPITIQQPQNRRRIPRERHDTITRIKESFQGSRKNGISASPHLSSPTPPTFVPDGSHQASRIGDYLLVEQVEGHNSGNVYRALNTNTNLQFICKVFEQNEFRNATETYSRIEPHECINHIVDIIHSLSNTYIFFQPGVPQEGNLSDKQSIEIGFKADNLHNMTRTQGRLSEEVAASYFFQVAKAVEHCHLSNIVIRDLKLRKFIFRDNERTKVMLEGLEEAYILESEDQEGITVKNGCIPYISPEILACSLAALSAGGQSINNTVNGVCAKASDVWSMGVMLYTMLVGRYPFEESQPSALFSKISRGKFIVPDTLSLEARDLIHNLLRRDPNERFRASDVSRHPWLVKRGHCWDSPRFVMPVGAGGDVRGPWQTEASSFHTVSSSRNTLSSFACHYEDQMVPDSYVSAEDETMFE